MKAVALAVLSLIAIFFVAFQLPNMFTAVTDFRTTELTEGYENTTPAAVTSANITLARALFQDDIIYATVTSNVTLDVPSAQTYNTTTRVLNVAGLQAGTNRMLTVVYKSPKLGIYAVADASVSYFPALLVILMIALPIIVIVVAAKGRG